MEVDVHNLKVNTRFAPWLHFQEVTVIECVSGFVVVVVVVIATNFRVQ